MTKYKIVSIEDSLDGGYFVNSVAYGNGAERYIRTKYPNQTKEEAIELELKHLGIERNPCKIRDNTVEGILKHRWAKYEFKY